MLNRILPPLYGQGYIPHVTLYHESDVTFVSVDVPLGAAGLSLRFCTDEADMGYILTVPCGGRLSQEARMALCRTVRSLAGTRRGMPF